MCCMGRPGATDQLIDARCELWIAHGAPAERLDRAGTRSVGRQECTQPRGAGQDAMHKRPGGTQDCKRFGCETVSLREVAFDVQNDTHRTGVPEVRIVSSPDAPGSAGPDHPPSSHTAGSTPGRPGSGYTASSSPPSASRRAKSTEGIGGFWRRLIRGSRSRSARRPRSVRDRRSLRASRSRDDLAG